MLHACCAICTCSILEQMTRSGIRAAVFFFNPNIHPAEEYIRRRDEVLFYAAKHGADILPSRYDPDQWDEAVKGLETEPEGGARCRVCFDGRLEESARKAAESGIKVFATTLGISRRKNLDEVNAAGVRAASKYPTTEYWAINWRKGPGTRRMHEISKEENFYRQNYCGCRHSIPS
ncbi:MAG: epoxyqueuosine reductase QueH [Candidatus Omnitrophica bacterium]|nr:epoxyqueuosine reductase QueH [Candidatus Omnitrophota bacterium]